MEGHPSYVMTLSNSIIGVSVLAMPFCFKQCGIILSILMLLVSSVMSRLACYFLLKSAITTRRRTFEFLAFHAFGSGGKLMVELGIIGFLMGTCIAFFVIVGDLGPEIVTKLAGVPLTDTLRTTMLIGITVLCVLPLGLLKNVDSLSAVCTATIGFYFCLVLKVITESASHMMSENWMETLNLWKPNGLLQCLPIFSMALFCQTQLFEIYDSLPNPSLENMNGIIRVAVNICTVVYIFVGLFGYIAFSSQPFSGNILLSFSPSPISDIIKLGFILSVVFSFPLVIFPCRTSLNSFLFKRGLFYEASNNYIPDARFKLLTLSIITISLIIALLIPNIELVLGLVGSTIGKNTNERLLALGMIFTGLLIMMLGTYANLYAIDETPTPIEIAKAQTEIPLQPIPEQATKPKTVYKPKVTIIPNVEVAEMLKDANAIKDNVVVAVVSKKNNTVELFEMPVRNVSEKSKNEEVNIDAIKKEDKELQEENIKDEEKKEMLLKTLKKHEEEQKKLIAEQREILKEIKEEKKALEENKMQSHKQNEQVEAVKQIAEIAKMAIETLSQKNTGVANKMVPIPVLKNKSLYNKIKPEVLKVVNVSSDKAENIEIKREISSVNDKNLNEMKLNKRVGSSVGNVPFESVPQNDVKTLNKTASVKAPTEPEKVPQKEPEIDLPKHDLRIVKRDVQAQQPSDENCDKVPTESHFADADLLSLK